MLNSTWIIKNHEKKIMHIPPQDNCIDCLIKVTNPKNLQNIESKMTSSSH